MPDQKHILFVSSWYPNRNNPTHGIFNLHFAKAAALNNKVSVLHVCSEENLDRDFEIVESSDSNIFTTTIYYKKVKNKIPLLSQFLKRKKFLNAFELGFSRIKDKNNLPHLIQLNVVFPGGIGVFHLSEKFNIPYVVNEGWTGYMPEDGSYTHILHKAITRKIINKAKMILPVSHDLESAMLKQGLKGNYKVVPNVIDTEQFKIQNIKPGNLTRFIHISTLDDRQKNVSGIVRAFQLASKTEPNIELTIVGEGGDQLKLMEQVQQIGLQSKIKFKGRMTSDQLTEELNQHDSLIMFSNYESFCVVVGEAMACGKPVITSRAGGLTNRVELKFGISVEKKNEAQLRDAIVLFTKNKTGFDRNEIRKFITDNFSMQVLGKKLDEVYTAALSKNV